MKKVIQKQEEVVTYICDASNVLLANPDEFPLPAGDLLGCTIILNSGYEGMVDDTGDMNFHLSAKVTAEVLEFLSKKYSNSKVGQLFDKYELASFLEP
jgi:hypothetical protein